MAFVDQYKGEEVIYTTSYTVDRNLIKQHLVLGLLLSLTIIGMFLGIPIILRGWYLSQNVHKEIIITNASIYEVTNGEEVWNAPLTKVEKVLWRHTTMGFLELKIVLRNSFDHVIKGSFYDSEFRILLDVLDRQRRNKMK